MSVVDLVARSEQYNDPVPQEVAEALGAKLMAASADVARHEAAFLDLVGEFDAIRAAGWWTGIQSTAHWLSWACSIASGTAREHVRVARALRRMPLVRKAFATGDLTYSKVRELTRVIDELSQENPLAKGLHETDGPESDPQLADPRPAEAVPEPDASDPGIPQLNEAGLVEFAQACTASQLARTVSGWRAARGSSRARRSKQKVSWTIQEDGSVHLTAILPAGEGSAVITAIQAATDANTDPEPRPGDEQPDDAEDPRAWQQKRDRTRVEALAEICNHYLASCPDDRSGEDRTMVVIEVGAEALAQAEAAERRSRGNGPDDMAPRASGESAIANAISGDESGPRSRGNVDPQVPAASTRPAAEKPLPNLKCRIRGGPSIEPSDAQAALCDSIVLGIITDPAGLPLAVGRERRLVTKHQRRALMTRDSCCQYPGCHRTRHLQAHHRESWAVGGRTDLENLICSASIITPRFTSTTSRSSPARSPVVPFRGGSPDPTDPRSRLRSRASTHPRPGARDATRNSAGIMINSTLTGRPNRPASATRPNVCAIPTTTSMTPATRTPDASSRSAVAKDSDSSTASTPSSTSPNRYPLPPDGAA